MNDAGERARRYLQTHVASVTARYARLRAAGRCVTCGKRKAVAGRALCRRCQRTRQIERKAARAVRLARGECVKCGLPAALGKWCRRCRNKARKAYREKHWQKRPARRAIYHNSQGQKISRQRYWQLQQEHKGQCRLCHKKIYRNKKCRQHWHREREQARARYVKKTRGT